jgi:histidinol-phosphate/aromatic aminotransferase/cobyric acid decarboxylase-like protein
VHPQFTEPEAALRAAGHVVDRVVLRAADGFTLPDGAVPADADLVMIGNPTNPTGVLHPTASIRALLRPGRLVVVDEAFMDCVPGETESLAQHHDEGLVVIRSLTKHWSIPGIRAGYLLGSADTVAALHRGQVPWSVSTSAAAAVVACTTEEAAEESRRRAEEIADWRKALGAGLGDLGIPHLESAASFVLARVGRGVHGRLRSAGIAVRRADTFPGLDDAWVRIAVRPPATTDRLVAALRAMA